MVDTINKLLIFIFIIILISFFITLFFFLRNDDNSDFILNLGDNIEKDIFDDSDFNEDLSEDNISVDIGESSKGAGGAGGGGGGSSGSSNNLNCIQYQISYSLTTLPENTICFDFQEGKCTQKEIICNAEVRNFDDSISGNFEIQFDLYDDSNISNVIAITSASSFVNALTKKTISKSVIITGEDANISISCQSTTLDVPFYEICS